MTEYVRMVAYSVLGVLIFPALALSSLAANLRRRVAEPPLTAAGESPRPLLRTVGFSGVIATIVAFLPDLLVYVSEISPRRARFTYPYPFPFRNVTIPVAPGVGLACAAASHESPLERPTLILIPGMFNSKSQRCLVKFATRAFQDWKYNVLVADMRGFGETARVAPGPTSATVSERTDVVALAKWAQREWEPTRVFLSGFSYGAVVALAALASDTDHLISGCVAFAPYARLEDVVSWLSSPVISIRGDAIFQLFFQYLFRRMCSVNGIPEIKTVREYFSEIVAPACGMSVDRLYAEGSASGFINLISTPTLIVHCLDDPIIQSSQSVLLQNNLNGDRKAIQFMFPEKGGHYGNWLVAPRETEAATKKFFDRCT